MASEGPEFAGRLELMDLGTKHGLRSRGSCRVKGLFSRCRSMNQPELTHWIPGLEKHFPGSRFSPGDSSAAARPCLGVRGSQSQQVGVESGRGVKVWFGEALEFPRFSGIPVAPQRSRFIYLSLAVSEPFLGPHPAAKVQTVNSGRPGHNHSWTFVLALGGPSGIDEFPTFSFLSAAAGTGSKRFFWIPSSSGTAGDSPRWSSGAWAVFLKDWGGRGCREMPQLSGICSHQVRFGYAPSGGTKPILTQWKDHR